MKANGSLALDLDHRTAQSDHAGDLTQEQDVLRFVERFRRVWLVLPATAKRMIREIALADLHQQYDAQARQVLEFLNSRRPPHKVGFRPVEANLRLIRARLAEGYSIDTLRAIVAVKARQASAGDFPPKYLRPLTLFNAEKCAQYEGELGASR